MAVQDGAVILALAIIGAVLLLCLFRGGYEKPWTKPGTGTRRDHRAAYGKKGFRI